MRAGICVYNFSYRKAYLGEAGWISVGHILYFFYLLWFRRPDCLYRNHCFRSIDGGAGNRGDEDDESTDHLFYRILIIDSNVGTIEFCVSLCVGRVLHFSPDNSE